MVRGNSPTVSIPVLQMLCIYAALEDTLLCYSSLVAPEERCYEVGCKRQALDQCMPSVKPAKVARTGNIPFHLIGFQACRGTSLVNS